jgi:hypothetical protein
MSVAGERGSRLTTILMMVLMSALLVGFTTAVMSDQGYRAIDRDRARAFYVAQSGIEKLNADLARLFVSQVGPNDAAVTALGAAANRPTIPNVSFVDVGTSPAYAVTPLGPATSGIVSSGPYEGLMALKRQFQLDATARAADGGEVHLKRVVEAVAIPVFQFGIFSDVDLAFNAADNFDFGGRVHTNRNLYLAEGSGSTLYLRDKVTAVGEVVRKFLSNGVAIGSAGQTGTVNMTRGNSSGPFRALTTSEGSVTDGPTSSLNNSWPTIHLSTYVGNIRNSRTGVKPLNLDLVAANGVNIDLIRRPPSTEPVTSGIFAERYFKKVSVRVLLSDEANDIMSLPTVSAGQPVRLEDWNTALPAGYGPIAGNMPPVARSAGRYPDVPAGAINARNTNVSVASGSNRTITLDNTRPMPAYFKLPATMTLSWAATSMTISCTGKNQYQFSAAPRRAAAAPCPCRAAPPHGRRAHARQPRQHGVHQHHPVVDEQHDDHGRAVDRLRHGALLGQHLLHPRQEHPHHLHRLRRRRRHPPLHGLRPAEQHRPVRHVRNGLSLERRHRHDRRLPQGRDSDVGEQLAGRHHGMAALWHQRAESRGPSMWRPHAERHHPAAAAARQRRDRRRRLHLPQQHAVDRPLAEHPLRRARGVVA